MPVHEIADDDASSRKDRRARGEFQYDERGDLLRARVPMMLRDADRREVQRQIKTDAARRELQRRIVDAAGNDGLALLKPGSRRLADASAYAACTHGAWIAFMARVFSSMRECILEPGPRRQAFSQSRVACS